MAYGDRVRVLALLVGCIWVLPSCGLDTGGVSEDDAAAQTDGPVLDQHSDAVTSNAVDSSSE